MRKHCKFWLLLAAGGLVLPAVLSAEENTAEGVVRLGSGRPVDVAPANVDGEAQPVGYHWGGGGCNNGACGYGYGPPCGFDGAYGCPSGFGHGICGGYGCDPCGYGYCRTCGLIDHLRCHAVGGCHHSPDHGWAPPGKHPRPRLAATYRRWFPGAWTGEPPEGPGYCYPMVYTPTDTTQLGYYYQRVPVWQHRAGMIPPVPHPDTFHIPNFGACGHGAAACGYEGHYAGGYAYGGGYVAGDGSDIVDDGSVTEGAPVDTAPLESAPAAIEEAPGAEPYIPGPAEPPAGAVPPAPVPAPTPPAAGTDASGLEKSALAPYLFSVPQR